jgi:hypothetical protein
VDLDTCMLGALGTSISFSYGLIGADGLKVQFGTNLPTFGGNAASVCVVLVVCWVREVQSLLT